MARRKTGIEEQITLRLSSAMMSAIRDFAEKENRSLNAQIITLLQESLALRRTLDAQRERPTSPPS